MGQRAMFRKCISPLPLQNQVVTVSRVGDPPWPCSVLRASSVAWVMVAVCGGTLHVARTPRVQVGSLVRGLLAVSLLVMAASARHVHDAMGTRVRAAARSLELMH